MKKRFSGTDFRGKLRDSSGGLAKIRKDDVNEAAYTHYNNVRRGPSINRKHRRGFPAQKRLITDEETGQVYILDHGDSADSKKADLTLPLTTSSESTL